MADEATQFREAWHKFQWETNRAYSALRDREAGMTISVEDVLQHHWSALMAAQNALAILGERVFGERPSVYESERAERDR
jgi:hypothetical protein